MRVDDEIPRLRLEKLYEGLEIELFEVEPKLVAARVRRARLIEHVVEVAQGVRGLVDEVEIELPVEPFEETVGHFQDVEVLHRRVRQCLPEREFDGLGSAQMSGADGRGENENTRGHVESFS